MLASTPGLHTRMVESAKAKTEALTSKGYDLSTWYVPDGYEKHVANATKIKSSGPQ